ncbi:uncharacterized protein N7515_003321 [Penicillium bovifimosum]|uniref:Uncharacterized protein n=1 Tax=Penicillium bovifimosum TaxID=126998 RepID=A0A9W9H4U8_9EURO|nr:uncharacterized protein N7515_003321 [Penicillium bovifimosum]KAJ5138473.1 hypothetical protein N7515_003321 [Penicillium bovifimosum]
MATANSITNTSADAGKPTADLESITLAMEKMIMGADKVDIQDLDDYDMHLMYLDKVKDGIGSTGNQPKNPLQDPNENNIFIFPHDGHLVAVPVKLGSNIVETRVKLRDMCEFPQNTNFLFEDPEVVRQFFDPPEEDRAGLAAVYKAAAKLILVPFFRLEYLFTLKLRLAPFSARAAALPPSSRLNLNFRTNTLLPTFKLNCTTISKKGVDVDLVRIVGEVANDLFEDWRAACRALPRNHGIKEVAISLEGVERAKQDLAPNLLQFVSTIFALKAKGPFHCFLLPPAKRLKEDFQDFLERTLIFPVSRFEVKDEVTGNRPLETANAWTRRPVNANLEAQRRAGSSRVRY